MSHKVNFSLLLSFLLSACATTLPDERHKAFRFPETRVYIEEPTGKWETRKYKPLGWVKSKENWPTLEQDAANNPLLCKNYFNKASHSLLKEAEKVGADAVIKVRSVVILMDGRLEEYPTPECSDDGAHGEILLKGIAIQYLKEPKSKRAAQ